MELIYIAIIVVVGFLLVSLAVTFFSRSEPRVFESPKERAGRRGEAVAFYFIQDALLEGDEILRNIEINIEEGRTELDCVVINNRGVFIIEVKNLSGQLVGDENDRDWMQYKYSSGGNLYQKIIGNPIGQVRREVFLLSRYLKHSGIDVWIEGYVLFIEDNSPVKSEYVLRTQKDIDRVIHRGYNNKLSNAKTRRILEVLG